MQGVFDSMHEILVTKQCLRFLCQWLWTMGMWKWNLIEIYQHSGWTWCLNHRCGRTYQPVWRYETSKKNNRYKFLQSCCIKPQRTTILYSSALFVFRSYIIINVFSVCDAKFWFLIQLLQNGRKKPLYRVSQEERAKLREGVPYVKLYQYNPKHLYPKLNGYGDNGKRSLKLWQLLHTYWLPNSYW